MPLPRNALLVKLDLGRDGACGSPSPTSIMSRGPTAPASAWPSCRGCWTPSPADELTWPSDRPNRRIDDIWLLGHLAAGFVATTSTASDHRGIAVTVQQRR